MENTETKQEKFNRIIPIRLENFRIACERLSKMGNRFSFQYSEDQKNKVLEIAEQEFEMIKQKFNEVTFKFQDNGK